MGVRENPGNRPHVAISTNQCIELGLLLQSSLFGDPVMRPNTQPGVLLRSTQREA